MSDTPDRDRLLRIYLDDHRAGAAGGRALAARAARRQAGARFSGRLADIAEQIEADVRTLDRVRAELDAKGGLWKRAVALVGERLGRLKLNGRVLRSSPLSLVLELEALIVGVTGKRQLWEALLEWSPGGEVADVRLAELVDRAEQQLGELRSLHAEAAGSAFGQS